MTCHLRCEHRSEAEALLLTSSTVLSLHKKMKIQSLKGWELCAVMVGAALLSSAAGFRPMP